MEKQQYIQRKDTRKKNIFQLLAGLALIVIINIIGSSYFFRIDMTSEKRFTLTPATKELIQNLDDIVYFRVYLDGDFPAGFRRLRNEAREMLNEFGAYSDYIQYDFINPAEGKDRKEVEASYRELMAKGLEPTQLQIRGDDASSQQIIFPGAIVSYKGKEVPLHILHEQMGVPSHEIVNSSVQALEYNLASAIRKLTVEEKTNIAFLEGQNELEPKYVSDISRELSGFYNVKRININNDPGSFDDIKTLIVADPRVPFTEEDKFLIDQFIMHGGSVLWLIDPVFADMDSLNYAPVTIGMPLNINIDDMLFRYGVRLNTDLIQNLKAAPIPVTTGYIGDRPQISLEPWVFYPIVSYASNHPVVKNLNAVRTQFVSTIDTVGAPDVEKTKLLQTSPYSRVLGTPVRISLDILQHPMPEHLYNDRPQTVAVLLEGEFESIYRHRPHPDVILPGDFTFRETSKPTAQIVVSDGSVIRNQFDRQGKPLPLGYDRYSGMLFGNRDFILNAVNYLADDTGIMEARAKEIRLRMLDERRMRQNRLAVQTFNIIMPISLVIIFGLIKRFFRSVKYSRKKQY